MAEIINMPRLSDTMEEGTVVQWFKKVGDSVQEGDILAEIETDKATMEFESFHQGILLYVGIQEGEKADVDALLAIIGDQDEDITELITSGSSQKEENQTNQLAEEKSLTPKDSQGESNKSNLKDRRILESVHVIKMPQLSDTMEEGKVIEWRKKVGDQVQEGEVLAEIESDKAVMEFEAFESGTLLHIGIQEGESALVDKLLAIIGEKDADVDQILKLVTSSETDQPKLPSQKEENNVREVDVKKPQPIEKLASPISPSIVSINSSPTDKMIASPLAKKLAKEKGIQLQLIKGTGTNGRIIKRDIESFDPKIISTSSKIRNFEEQVVAIVNTPMRKAIAKRLSSSKFTAPHYYLTIQYDVENLVAFRQQYNASGQYKVSFNDIILKAVAFALKQHPQVNAQWNDQKIVQNKHIHLGVAIGIDDGLVVPVVKFADQRDIHELGSIVKDFAVRARDKKLKQDEIEGSTFTVSNLGMFGIEEFTSIINQPNVAILSIGAIVEKPVVKERKMVIGHTMKVTLASDHRVVDGVTGAKFLQTLGEFVENPILLII
ncbi:MAG: 2-oxo acid dehydrogenase subunit E2 [Flavobacteriaceae bacterium]|nr:2-oxo acid dehydrogenase subunit E2 [Flavobacteriaceae bacterium]MCY4267819.1 2-oxo acid dehydrogenase subunit E2 [Flavobacteriaceae bacterium]MCY4298648.1 2-oxo acid dehydrogenase subunit E2 [Flavobacteriaceae bacterium]